MNNLGRSGALAFLIALFALPAAQAASLFDGKWKGEGKPTSACADKAEVAFTIKDGEFVQFVLVGPRGQTRTAKGMVNDSGSATVEYGTSRLRGALTFVAASFEGKMETLCGPRDFTGVKE